MRLLWPDTRSTSPEELAAGLRLGDLAPDERPYVVVNMVASLDGKAAVDGHTRALSSDLDRRYFHLLRTQGDAVMVGGGTLRAERYGSLTKTDELRAARERDGLAPDPLAVVVSARLDLPADLPLLNEPTQPVLIATASDDRFAGAGDHVRYLRTGRDLSALLARLRTGHGIRSVVCEGGPTLNFNLISAGLVDELFVTLTPALVGGADALTIVAGEALPEAAELTLVSLAEGVGNLFTRWRVKKPLQS